MKHIGMSITWILVILLVQALIVVWATGSHVQAEQYRSEQVVLQQELSQLQSELYVAQQELVITVEQTAELSQKLETTQAINEELLAYSEQVTKDVRAFKTDIEAKISWLSENAQLDALLPADYFTVTSSVQHCLQQTASSCTINTACLYAVNRYDLEFTYIPDYLTTGREDGFQTLQSIIDNKGGDCEDWSSLTVAQVRALSAQCSGKTVEIEAFTTGHSTQPYVISAHRDWVVPSGIVGKGFGDFNKPVIVCGHMHIQYQNIIGGHCLVAFTKEEVTIDTVQTALDGAYLMEPQQGNFYGIVGKDIPLLTSADKEFPEQSIWLVVTQNDMISHFNGRWQSYQAIQTQLDELIQRQ